MNSSVHLKKNTFFGSNIAFAFFKNLEAYELSSFFENLSETFFNEELVPVSVVISGSTSYEKTWRKQAEQIFDENPWINFWIPSSNEQSILTGYFFLVGKSRIKTLLSDNYTLKMIELSLVKISVAGEIKISGKANDYLASYTKTINHITEALSFSGCSLEHIYQQSWCLPSEWANEHQQKRAEKLQTLIHLRTSPFQLSFYGVAIQTSNNVIRESINKYPLVDNTLKIYSHQISDDASTHVHWVIETEKAISDESEKIILFKTVFHKISELTEVPLQWNQLTRGIVFISDKNSTKQMKEYLKEQKIPLSTLLFIDAVENQQSWFEFDFQIPL